MKITCGDYAPMDGTHRDDLITPSEGNKSGDVGKMPRCALGSARWTFREFSFFFDASPTFPAPSGILEGEPQKAGISPPNLPATMQTRTPPLMWNIRQTRLLAWDYTAAPDLTYSANANSRIGPRAAG